MAIGFRRLGALTLAIALPGFALAQAARTTQGSHPDFSGIYFPAVGPGMRSQTPSQLPYNDAAKKLVADYQKNFTLDDDPGRYCIWPGMPRAVWGAPFSVEIQQRPQDVSIYWEGYGMYRKIYMADHNPPKQLVPSAMGHSVARWEGDTLVVETDKLKPYPYMTRMATSSAAHVVERLHLEEHAAANGQPAKFLVDELVVTDPKVYTEPIKIKATLQLRPDLSLIEYTCTDTLWDDYLTKRGLTLPDLDELPGGAKE
jgi:hypothetical protein